MSLRHYPFEGTPNFRDYGGYPTVDGKTVKWGRLFRSGQLSELTVADLDRFEALDIRLVVDFRSEAECRNEPSRFPSSNSPELLLVPITPGSRMDFYEAMRNDAVSSEEVAVLMEGINREFVLEHGDAYRKMLAGILDLETGGSLVHCSAGKDRTGFAAAMVLSALGVAEDIILQDYMLTSQYFLPDREIAYIREKYGWQQSAKALRPVMEVRESYLRNAFDAIKQEFQSVANYQAEVLDFGEPERARLRAIYLDD